MAHTHGPSLRARALQLPFGGVPVFLLLLIATCSIGSSGYSLRRAERGEKNSTNSTEPKGEKNSTTPEEPAKDAEKEETQPDGPSTEEGEEIIHHAGEDAVVAGQQQIHDAGLGFGGHLIYQDQAETHRKEEEEMSRIRAHMADAERVSTEHANEALRKIARNADEKGREAAAAVVAGNGTAAAKSMVAALRNASEHLMASMGAAVDTNHAAAGFAVNAARMAANESNKVGKFQNTAMTHTNEANWEVRKAVDFVKRGNLQAQLGSEGAARVKTKAEESLSAGETANAMAKDALGKAMKNKEIIKKMKKEILDASKFVGDQARTARETLKKITR